VENPLEFSFVEPYDGSTFDIKEKILKGGFLYNRINRK